MRGTPAGRAVLLAALLAAVPLAGQAGRDSTRTDSGTVLLPSVTVQATRPDATFGGASSIRARVAALPLAVAATVEDLLRTLPAVHVRRNSRGEAEISVRGSGPRQVAVLVDGLPLHLAWDARADLSVVPAAASRDVTVVRGLSSMLYGPNVLGGVIELSVGQTFEQPGRATAEIAGEVDHAGGYAARAAVQVPHAGASGGWLFRAGAGRHDTPGVPLARGVTEPLPAANDLRVNTDVANVDGFVALRYAHRSGAWFSAAGSAFSAARGIAAELGTAEARFWRYPRVARGVVALSGGTGLHRTPLGHGDLEASLGMDVGRTEVISYTGRDYTTPEAFENGDDRTLTLRLLADHTLGRHGDLHTALTIADIRHDESLPSGAARYRQRLWSLGLETVWRVLQHGHGAVDWLHLRVGGAFDAGQTPESGGREPLATLHDWGARAGATMGVGGGGTLIHASFSRRARFPALRELYSGALNRFTPNPGLRPEWLVALEGGVTTRIGPGEAQAVVFRHELRDAVVRTTLPDRTYLRVNRDRLTSLGVELVAAVPIGPLAVGADVTAQSVALTDAGTGTTNAPENLPSLFGGMHAAVQLPWNLRTRGDVRFTGAQSCIAPDTGNDVRLDRGAVVSAEMSRTWSLSSGMLGRVQATVAVDNVGGTALYDQCGLPRPGRLIRVGVRAY